jgi:heavy metal translocating P-type ATPase
MSLRPAAVLPPAAAFSFILLGLGLRLLGHPTPATAAWTAGLFLVGLPLVARTGLGALRGRFAADLIAALAIVAAMILGEPLPGLVVALMQSGGEALERVAAGRASRAVQELEAIAPRIAHRRRGGHWEDIPADVVRVGDILLVRPGEMVPCDALVVEGEGGVDIARLTGEPVPKAARAGVRLRSGSLLLDAPLVLRAEALARESLYAQVVEQVRTAQASKAPLQRLADRVAVWFTPLTLAVCAAAWAVSGEADRVLAVLVVATPCPLILATPVAIVGGINRAARRRIIVRHGGALETLARVTAAVFDKTGTVTLGQPEVEAVMTVAPLDEREVLRLAASVEQGAGHPLARSLVRAAERRHIMAGGAQRVVEAPGRGVSGMVEGRRVTVGALSLIREREPAAAATLDGNGAGEPGLRAYIAVDGKAGGIVTFADRPREGADRVLEGLRRLGLRRHVLLSGDDSATVASVARELGIREVQGDLLPQDKVAYVRRLRQEGEWVLMVGDGINDAPALSAAEVGMAMAAHGGGIAAEAADVVVLEDDLGRVVDAVAISQQTMRVAYQSVAAGLGLSLVAMVIAALGYIPPTIGALLQEGIDLGVILNALRAAK